MYFIDDLCGVPARLYLLARGMLGVLAVEVVVAVVIVVAVVVVKSVGRWFVCQQPASRRGRKSSQSHKDAILRHNCTSLATSEASFTKHLNALTYADLSNRHPCISSTLLLHSSVSLTARPLSISFIVAIA